MHKTKTSLPTNDGGIPRRMFHVFLLSTNNTCYQWHVLDTSNIYSIPYHLVTNEIITSKSLTYPFTKPSCPCFFPSQWHHQNPDPPPMTPSNYCWEEFWSLQVCCWPMEIIPFRWCRSILKKKTSLKPPTNIIQLSLYIYILYWYIYISISIYIEFYAIQSLSPVVWVSSKLSMHLASVKNGIPNSWMIIPDTQRAIIYHCQYQSLPIYILYIYYNYIYIAMITIIILYSILLTLIIANVYYIVYILYFPI